MAHYALVDENNIVIQVITGRDEDEIVDGIFDWEDFYSKETGLRAIRTSYNTSGGIHRDPETQEPSADQSKAIRYNYAGPGFTYDADRDAFVPPQPFPSWTLDESTCLWEAPVAYPAEGAHVWDEQAGDWVEVPDETV